MPNITSKSIRAQLSSSSILNIGIVASPESIETTVNGTVPGHALYDTPPKGSQPTVLSRSSRSRGRTERAKAGYDSETAASIQRSTRSKNTRARNRAKLSSGRPHGEPEMEDHNQPASKSPTPIFVTDELESQPTRAQAAEFLNRKFQKIVQDSGTQTLLDIGHAISNDPAYATQLEEQDTQTRFLAPTEISVGGGFHLDHPSHRPGNTKTYQSSKPRREHPLPIEIHSDTDECSESEANLGPPAPRLSVSQQAASHLPSRPILDTDSPFYVRSNATPFLGYLDGQSARRHPGNDVLVTFDPDPARGPGSQAHGHSSDPAPISSSQLLRDQIPTDALGQDHSAIVPTTSSQLHAEKSMTNLLTSSRSLGDPIPTAPSHDDTLQLHAERSITHISSTTKSPDPPVLPAPSPPRQGNPPEAREPHRTQHPNCDSRQLYPEPPTCAPSPAPQRSTGASSNHRAHHSASRGAPTPVLTTAPMQQSQAVSSSTVVAPARKRAATGNRPAGALVYGTRLNIIEINSQRLPPQTTGSGPIRGRRKVQPRNSSTAPRTNMAPSSRSFSARRTGHGAHRPQPQPQSRPASEDVSDSELEPDLLEGFDANKHIAEFAAQGVQVKYHKPTTKDLHGRELALWWKVRDVVWGHAAGQGNVSVRSLFSSWADSAYYQLQLEMYPHKEPRPMSDNMRTVVLNSFSNCRFQDKEALRKPVKNGIGFKDPSNDEQLEANKRKFRDAHPNGFHCLRSGDELDPYEGPIMPIALATTFFDGPQSIGAQYPGLFEMTDDPEDAFKHLAILAYLATMVQFCIEEWEGGFLEKRDLNSSYLLSLYICHFKGLQSTASRAPGRLLRKYNEWFESALAAAKAPTVYKQKYTQPIILPEQVRPDTPPPTSGNTPQPTSATPTLATANPAPQTTSSVPGPFRLPRASSMSRYSPLAPTAGIANTLLPRARVRQITPRRSPSHASLSPGPPHIVTFGGPSIGQPHIPALTPERDAEGRYTTRAKGKGPATD